jgi:hypothetical protein
MLSLSAPNIEKLKAKQNIKGLIKALKYQKDFAVRRAAVKALGSADDSRAILALSATLRDEDELLVIRLVAIDSLVNIGSVKVIAPLIDGVGLPSQHLSEAAISGLMQQGFGVFIRAVIMAKLDLYAGLGRPWGFPNREWQVFFSPECLFSLMGSEIRLEMPDSWLQLKRFDRKALTDVFVRLMRAWGAPDKQLIEAMKAILKPHAQARVLRIPSALYDTRELDGLLRDYDQLLKLLPGTKTLNAVQYLTLLERFRSTE